MYYLKKNSISQNTSVLANSRFSYQKSHGKVFKTFSNILGLNKHLTSIIMSFRDFFSLYFCCSYKWAYLLTMEILNTCALRLKVRKSIKVCVSFPWENQLRHCKLSRIFYWYGSLKRSIRYCCEKKNLAESITLPLEGLGCKKILSRIS